MDNTDKKYVNAEDIRYIKKYSEEMIDPRMNKIKDKLDNEFDKFDSIVSDKRIEGEQLIEELSIGEIPQITDIDFSFSYDIDKNQGTGIFNDFSFGEKTSERIIRLSSKDQLYLIKEAYIENLSFTKVYNGIEVKPFIKYIPSGYGSNGELYFYAALIEYLYTESTGKSILASDKFLTASADGSVSWRGTYRLVIKDVYNNIVTKDFTIHFR